jgi:hypothetical protein
MTSLKTYEWQLAAKLGVSPVSLYERQRFLVRGKLLTPIAGRGPGSGVPADAKSVSVLLTSLLASDSNVDTKLTKIVASLYTTTGDECPLTHAKTFASAFHRVLLNKRLAGEVASISLQRPFRMATIHIKPSRDRASLLSEFVTADRITDPPDSGPFSVSATISGDLVRAIADDLWRFEEEEERVREEWEEWELDDKRADEVAEGEEKRVEEAADQDFQGDDE